MTALRGPAGLFLDRLHRKHEITATPLQDQARPSSSFGSVAKNIDFRPEAVKIGNQQPARPDADDDSVAGTLNHAVFPNPNANRSISIEHRGRHYAARVR
ncbi:hypothetical protein EVAR_96517_1 [Eumeta japonica]|uniref:Uncharacterized protein n=1 Tax=Eumeta variegata TaxID=151549 RepID=A0A4C1WEA6_EUMVA|nr:hypothetical protein EVAR_96517_1 [Eumeta japonica]